MARADLPGVSPTLRRGFATIEHRRAVGEWPALKPRTYTEKLIRKTLLDRRRYLVETADKIAVRRYVADRVGADALPELLAVTDDPQTLDFGALPAAFVVKASHGSGWVEVVADRDAADHDALRSAARSWLSQRYDPYGRSWWYRDIPPVAMVEEFLGDPQAGPPDDFKLFVMNGRWP